MKKQILILLILVVISSCAFALKEGDKLNQNQLDFLATTDTSLACKSESVSLDLLAQRFVVEHSCLKIIRDVNVSNTIVPYFVKRERFIAREFFFSEILQQIASTGLPNTIVYMQTQIIQANKSIRLSLLNEIEQWQTSKIPDLQNQLVISDANLN